MYSTLRLPRRLVVWRCSTLYFVLLFSKFQIFPLIRLAWRCAGRLPSFPFIYDIFSEKCLVYKNVFCNICLKEVWFSKTIFSLSKFLPIAVNLFFIVLQWKELIFFYRECFKKKWSKSKIIFCFICFKWFYTLII